MDMKITRLELLSHPIETASGNQCIAIFDVQIGPLAIARCTLVRRGGEYQDLKVYTPTCRVHGTRGGTTILDAELRLEIHRRAVALYELQIGADEAA